MDMIDSYLGITKIHQILRDENNQSWMSKRKKRGDKHYVNNKEFTEAIIEC
jgi:hypothetical protein